MNFINEKIDNNQVILALSLDLTKAFDTIDHDILPDKLESLGFKGPFLRFFKNCFISRTQKVRIRNGISDTINLTCGVPQGSVLRPMLFNIHMNFLAPLPLFSNIDQYADDTALVLANENDSIAASALREDIK